MAEQPGTSTATENGASRDSSPFAAPQIAVPKGGGAIRGIDEKFAANPVTGTGSLSVPIYASPGRPGVGPQLTLSYDSGAGNGPFGFGWSLSRPSVTRKTDKGLPLYRDAVKQDDVEPDTFILSGAEDLVRVLKHDAQGQWVADVTTARPLYGQQYDVHGYRPRVEGLFALIERWVNVADRADTFWRSISRDNVTTWYGRSADSRIADPADPSHVFSWLICEQYDDKGNVISYTYKREDSDGVDRSQAHEANRSDQARTANLYIKRIRYGNVSPYHPNLTSADPVPLPRDGEWHFEVVFDYGEHNDRIPLPTQEPNSWSCRRDAFSSYRATFEVRTYRLCRRVLMFHHFDGELGVGRDCLVRSTDLNHAQPSNDSIRPFYSVVQSITQTGYRRDGAGGYIARSLPPLEFSYSEANVDQSVRDVDPGNLENLPNGLDGHRYQWIDLDGEGVSGVLTEQGYGWFYKPNLSPANSPSTGDTTPTPRFGPLQLVTKRPSVADLTAGRQQLLELTGDGRLDLAAFDGPTPGFYERTDDEDWEPFQSFASLPVLDWQNPNLKFIDVTGDGFADVLIAEDDAFWFHSSLGAAGFGAGERVPQAVDEERGPKVIFADGTETIFVADISGDGLSDVVRVRNGEVCYWPNLGYGRFGAKVPMDASPWFEAPDLFDGRRVRLADIDGSGTADILYVGSSGVSLYFNQSGNAWGSAYTLQHFPAVENLSSVTAIDLLGTGTACLVWSSPLAANARRPMRYIDLMGGQKPHLLTAVVNNLGAETRVGYVPSTRFYVADKEAGTPWVTRIPFPVHVVERIETFDWVGRNYFATHYTYHHGYFDGVEREFRGFGRVDQLDTEHLTILTASDSFPDATNLDAASNVPPILTRTWIHTGVYVGGSVISRHMHHEYFREGDPATGASPSSPDQLSAMAIPDSSPPESVFLPDGTRAPYDPSPEEAREGCRALRGSILRQEVYALDGTSAAGLPYTVSERNYALEMLQPQGPNRYAVFFAHAAETVDFHYERKLFAVSGGQVADPANPPAGALTLTDPRVTHALTLDVDAYGNVLESVAIAYGRRFTDPSLLPGDTTQSTPLSTYTLNAYTNPVLSPTPDRAVAYRTPLPAGARTYELLQFVPDGTEPQVTNLFRLDEVRRKVGLVGDGAHDIPYEQLHPANLTPGACYRRLIEQTATRYRPDDMGLGAGDQHALLPAGVLEPLALPGCTYKLAFTPGLLTSVYSRQGAGLLPQPDQVLKPATADGGGYVDLESDGRWWVPSGRAFFSLSNQPAQEKADAIAGFYLPRRFEDPFGNTTLVTYDAHGLLVAATEDSVQNLTAAASDYRVLQPYLLTDPNGNHSEVRFDALGLVAGSALYGKSAAEGDSFATFDPDPPQADIDAFLTGDPASRANALLGTATTRVVYDVNRFGNTRAVHGGDASQAEPAFAATLSRETNVSDLAAGQQTKVQIAFSYSDGFGREIQKKAQAEPGPLDGGAAADPRWVGSGWTILNNKGKPVRQYEPFFTAVHSFEFGRKAGVSTILCYDPVERPVATVHANHSCEKLVFDPWRQETWDVNDMLSPDHPANDPDAGALFKTLVPDDYLPTWYQVRTDPALAAQTWPDPAVRAREVDAAARAFKHARTPAVTYLDPLGRTFYAVADNGTAGKYATRSELDIKGNQSTVTDARGRKVMTYDYDLLGTRIHQASMDAGERWMLNDVTGKLVRAWDSRGHTFRSTYDELRRPIGRFVLGTDAASDQRTVAAEVLFEVTEYGEGRPNDTALNFRTRVYSQRDMAGVVTNAGTIPGTRTEEAYDFKGNLLRSQRQFVDSYKALPNWSGAAPGLQAGTFVTSSRYDALNRVVSATTPDGSVARPTYNEANLLERVDVNLGGAAAPAAFVTNIDYNAKGQRTLVTHGNGTSTVYTYDPLTFRLMRLTTTRRADNAVLQDLSYTYDPAANITHVTDGAQDTIFFRNRMVQPDNDYTYDAIYRLIQATGREHLGQTGISTPTSYNDVPRVLLIHPGDGNAMGPYTERYAYDEVGNFQSLTHAGTNPNGPGWTRTYTYNAPSLLDPNQVNNRLTSTAVGNGAIQEPYTYDAQGSMLSMPQLQQMQWDFKDELFMTQRQKVNDSDQDGIDHQGERTYYIYDASGRRVRKATERQTGALRKERLYVGGYEVYREYDPMQNPTLERETLHVMDDKRRVALVETTTVDAGGGPVPTAATRYQLDNHLGSACLELDENGAVISYEEYFPYGGTSYQAGRSAAEVSLKRYRYTGKERDEESGLYYHGARYYAPWTGRWTACDPIGLKDGPNLYAYVNDDPIARTDPTGTDGNDDDSHEPIGGGSPGRGLSLPPAPRLTLNPANFWYSSLTQGSGVIPTGMIDVEAAGNLVASGLSGLGRSSTSSVGLQSGQLAVRWAVGSSPGWDVGLTGGGTYTSATSPTGPESVSTRGGSGAATFHGGWRSDARELPARFRFLGDLRPGLAFYAQAGGSYQRADGSPAAAGPTFSLLGAASLEQIDQPEPTSVDLTQPPGNPNAPSLSSVVLNPVFTWAGSGNLSQGPATVSNLVTAGGNLGVGVGFGQQFNLLAEGQALYEHGSPAGPLNQSVDAFRYQLGIVGTYSYLDRGSGAQTSSIAVGAWFFQERGTVSGTPTSDSPTGSFTTTGVLFGITLGYRRPASSF